MSSPTDASTDQEFAAPTLPGAVRTIWMGFERDDFIVDGCPSLIVYPKRALPGRPWIWRTQFFGAFPSVDLALLERGFHLAFMDLPNMYGAPVAMRHMEQFHHFIVPALRLAAKVVLEGFSRGGLYAFNWAALHPERVASIYVDAPVCDFKAWPGGKGVAPGSPQDWEECKRLYGLSEEEAMTYALNPVDNLQPIAAAGIPVIAVTGDADTLVPMEEHILVVAERYRQLGAEIEVIIKPGGGHHPHSLDDPAPVVDFILRHLTA